MRLSERWRGLSGSEVVWLCVSGGPLAVREVIKVVLVGGRG